MPLIAWAYIASASGLLLGFRAPLWIAIVAVMLGAGESVRRNSARGIALVALFGAMVTLAGTLPVPPPHAAPTASSDTLTTLGRQRASAAYAIDTVFRGDAPLARALLVADQSEIPKETRDRYADAGIVHMLSISGLHVAVIAASLELCCLLLHLPKRTAMLASVVVIVLYVAVIGFPPPAVRSGVMLAVSALSRATQRPTSRWGALAIGAAIPLAVPATVLDLGYQLSVGGIAGLIGSGAVTRRWIAPRLSGWRYAITRALTTSAIATAISAPLVAYAFGRLSLVAPVTNLVADPIVAVAQPMLFLGLVCAHWMPVAQYVADAAHPLLVAFDMVATKGAALPGSAIAIHPSFASAFTAGVAATATVWGCTSRFPARPALIACSAVCMLPWIP